MQASLTARFVRIPSEGGYIDVHRAILGAHLPAPKMGEAGDLVDFKHWELCSRSHGVLIR